MKKLLSIILVLCCVFAISGCGKNILYNAEINSHANDIIEPVFLENNQVSFEGDPYPKTRTFVISDSETYNEIFTDSAEVIDFNSKIAVLHIFVDVYVNRDYHIEEMIETDGALEIHFEVEEKHGVGDASQPFQRSLLIVMDKTGITNITMIKE